MFMNMRKYINKSTLVVYIYFICYVIYVVLYIVLFYFYMIYMYLLYYIYVMIYICFRAIWLNLPGMASIITLSCLVGVVMYAFYATCDPVKFGLVQKPDQVTFG